MKLVKTCSACPEQYDAYIGTEKVGYLRLRHGYFSVSLYGPEGPTIYEDHPNGDGAFTANERDYYLTKAVAAISAHLGSANYEIVDEAP